MQHCPRLIISTGRSIVWKQQDKILLTKSKKSFSDSVDGKGYSCSIRLSNCNPTLAGLLNHPLSFPHSRDFCPGKSWNLIASLLLFNLWNISLKVCSKLVCVWFSVWPPPFLTWHQMVLAYISSLIFSHENQNVFTRKLENHRGITLDAVYGNFSPPIDLYK